MSFEGRDYSNAFGNHKAPFLSLAFSLPLLSLFLSLLCSVVAFMQVDGIRLKNPVEDLRTSLTKPNPTTTAKGCLVIFYR